MRIADLVGSRGQDWHLLTAAGFVSMIVPLIVFFALQRYFVRGLMAGKLGNKKRWRLLSISTFYVLNSPQVFLLITHTANWQRLMAHHTAILAVNNPRYAPDC